MRWLRREPVLHEQIADLAVLPLRAVGSRCFATQLGAEDFIQAVLQVLR
jgi:hypothetical protein